MTESNQEEMINMGVLDRCLEIVNDESMDYECRSNCTGCFWNFSIFKENKKRIIEMGGIEAIIKGISSSNVDLIVNSCGAIMNLSLLCGKKKSFYQFLFLNVFYFYYFYFLIIFIFIIIFFLINFFFIKIFF